MNSGGCAISIRTRRWGHIAPAVEALALPVGGNAGARNEVQRWYVQCRDECLHRGELDGLGGAGRVSLDAARTMHSKLGDGQLAHRRSWQDQRVGQGCGNFRHCG